MASKPRPLAKIITLNKYLSPSNLLIQKLDCYQTYDQIFKEVVNLK